MKWHLVMVMIRSEAEVKDLLHVHEVQHIFCEERTTSSSQSALLFTFFLLRRPNTGLFFFFK